MARTRQNRLKRFRRGSQRLGTGLEVVQVRIIRGTYTTEIQRWARVANTCVTYIYITYIYTRHLHTHIHVGKEAFPHTSRDRPRADMNKS